MKKIIIPTIFIAFLVAAIVIFINNNNQKEQLIPEQDVCIVNPELCEEKEEVKITTNNLDEEKIKNTTYYSPTYETHFTLKNGEYSNQEENLTAGLTNFAFGDINNDNIEDAVAITYISGGGSGTFMELHALLNDYGIPVCFSSQALGDRVKIENILIENETIKLDLIVHGKDDPMCCPTQKEHQEYIFKDLKLQKKED